MEKICIIIVLFISSFISVSLAGFNCDVDCPVGFSECLIITEISSDFVELYNPSLTTTIELEEDPSWYFGVSPFFSDINSTTGLVLPDSFLVIPTTQFELDPDDDSELTLLLVGEDHDFDNDILDSDFVRDYVCWGIGRFPSNTQEEAFEAGLWSSSIGGCVSGSPFASGQSLQRIAQTDGLSALSYTISEQTPGACFGGSIVPVTGSPLTAPPTTQTPITTPPVTDPPITAPPTTNIPTIPLSGTGEPITAPPTTQTPITTPPVTDPPITSPPTTDAPAVPLGTGEPITAPPTTSAPITTPPVTDPPITSPPTTEAPAVPLGTGEPITAPPTTSSPITTPPVTDPPITAPPTTDAPTLPPTQTAAPITAPPTTTLPTTSNPTTSPPVTTPPTTSPPVTTPPTTSNPTTTPPVTTPPTTTPPVTTPPTTSPPTTTPPTTAPPTAPPGDLVCTEAKSCACDQEDSIEKSISLAYAQCEELCGKSNPECVATKGSNVFDIECTHHGKERCTSFCPSGNLHETISECTCLCNTCECELVD